MAQEIERKFLVTSEAWRRDVKSATRLAQGYLVAGKGATARIRVAGSKAFLTIKGETRGVSRLEFEYEIPVVDAEEILAQICEQPILAKTRHLVEHGGHTWEVDEFHGDNAGLVVAEIELGAEAEVFARPAWLGAEVSSDGRYFNVNLVRKPFRTW